MKLTVASLLLCALAVGGLWWYANHRDQCGSAGFGIMGSVQYCQRPDGSVYMITPPPVAPSDSPSDVTDSPTTSPEAA